MIVYESLEQCNNCFVINKNRSLQIHTYLAKRLLWSWRQFLRVSVFHCTIGNELALVKSHNSGLFVRAIFGSWGLCVRANPNINYILSIKRKRNGPFSLVCVLDHRMCVCVYDIWSLMYTVRNKRSPIYKWLLKCGCTYACLCCRAAVFLPIDNFGFAAVSMLRIAWTNIYLSHTVQLKIKIKHLCLTATAAFFRRMYGNVKRWTYGHFIWVMNLVETWCGSVHCYRRPFIGRVQLNRHDWV